MTAKEKMKLQAAGVRFGCHIDLEEGEQPDGCVKDYGAENDCIYARRHRTREGCKFWREVKGSAT
jgi:hypothetical protein